METRVSEQIVYTVVDYLQVLMKFTVNPYKEKKCLNQSCATCPFARLYPIWLSKEWRA